MIDETEIDKAAVAVNAADRELGEAGLQLARFRRTHVIFENHCITDPTLKDELEHLIARNNKAFANFQNALNRWAILKTQAEGSRNHKPPASIEAAHEG